MVRIYMLRLGVDRPRLRRIMGAGKLNIWETGWTMMDGRNEDGGSLGK